MAYNDDMAQKMRQALSDLAPFEERKMFGALGFMINGRLIICVGKEDVMYKIGPECTLTKIDSKEAEPVTMNNRTMKSWVFVKNDHLESTKYFSEWLKTALDYNFANS